ncbi:uncharacterized protein [Elaeis guineensis]|uniref:Uncharacterized protein LOC105053486 n=1 Tax=Elaeis guineensis var. tenera TaxID=51953 RepID=A0A6I9RVA7_ELAGV|nr:uncharacterized protein LOC105053486 [Elaeis guineensis]
MGARRRTLLLGFVVALFLGVAIYFRLWAIDNESFSTDDREVLRKQFERANLEAMDESAEWRMKYDREVEKSRLVQDELLKNEMRGRVQASLAGSCNRMSVPPLSETRKR